MTSFNIDQWLSGEEGTRVVEAMAREIDSTPFVITKNPGPITTAMQERLRDEARRYLRAALSLTTTETCKVCGGVGEVTTTEGATSKILGRVIPCPNLGCKGGTVPGEPLLLSALVERVGYMARPESAYNTPTFSTERSEHINVPVYARPLEKEDET